MSSEYAIYTEGLTKMYSDTMAVNSLDLRVQRGSVYGFLGLNGAGKTTTIKMLLNLVHPSGGKGSVLGYDIAAQSPEILELVGYVPEETNIYEYLKISEVVNFCRDVCKRWDINVVGRYLDLFELPVGKKVRELSKGMKNQLALAVALGSSPELLILDEPTGGLDPVKIRDFYRVILEQVAETGQTVFFSSHQLHEVERFADTVGIIHNGRLVFERAMDEIKTGTKRIRIVFPEGKPDAVLENVPGVASITRQGRGFIIDCDSRAEEVCCRLECLGPMDLELIDVSLEELFIRYTGGEERG